MFSLKAGQNQARILNQLRKTQILDFPSITQVLHLYTVCGYTSHFSIYNSSNSIPPNSSQNEPNWVF